MNPELFKTIFPKMNFKIEFGNEPNIINSQNNQSLAVSQQNFLNSCLGKRTSEKLAQNPLYYKYLSHEVLEIDEDILLQLNIKSAKNLLSYLTDIEICSRDVAVDVIFENETLSEETRLESFKTSSGNPIQIVYRHIKFNKNSTDISEDFFTQRGIRFTEDIYLKKNFEPYLQQIKGQNFSVSDGHLSYIQRALAVHKFSCVERVRVLMDAFLVAAIAESEENDLSIACNSQIRIDTQSPKLHLAEPYYVLMDSHSGRVLLICQSREQNIQQAVLENFDQLRSYSLVYNQIGMKYLYGLASTLDKWIFTCYVVPEKGQKLTSQNFLISRMINIDTRSETTTKDSIRMIVKYIRRFLVKDTQNNKVK